MKEPKTSAELAAQLRNIADRGTFPVHADEQLILRTAAKYIEEVANDGWHDAMKEKPEITGTYLCVTVIPNHSGGYILSQDVIWWEDPVRWCCEDMIVAYWREKPEYPTGGWPCRKE